MSGIFKAGAHDTMRISESRIRRIIREEARQLLREGDEQSVLKVSEAYWYNDYGPDGGTVTISFEWEQADGDEQATGDELVIDFSSSPGDEESLIETITSSINGEIADKLGKDDYETQRVNEDQVKAAINAAAEQNLKSESIAEMLSQMKANFSSDNSGDW